MRKNTINSKVTENECGKMKGDLKDDFIRFF
jgi:hypothetical protein